MSDLVNLGFRADTRGLLGAQRELDRTTAAGGRLDKQSATLTRTLGLVGAAITAVGVTAGTRQIIQYADSWANLNTQLRQVTKSEQELVGIRSQLLAVSRDTRINLASTVDLYAEMTRGTSELGISSEKLLGITKTLNNLFLAGGKPLSEMTGAIRQLNQGFASGVLRGDEFNSVAEGAPRILDAMAAKLNMTRGELRAFAATGGITAEVMIDALADFEGTAQKLADTVKITFEQTMGLVQTNITEFVGQNELLTSSVDSLGSKLLSLSENIDAVGYAMGAAAAVVGVSLLPVMGKYLISVGAAAYANITAVPAVTGMSAALGVQARALTAGAIAANAFGVAWRFALGPVGLLVTALGAAAVAFNLVSENMDIANKKAKEHADAMSELETIYAKWSKTRLEGERNKLLERSNEILFERLDIEEKIQKLSANATMQRGMETIVNPEVLAEIERLEKSLASLGNENENIDNSLGKVLAALDAFITKKKEATTTVDKSIEANRKLADSYNSQILSLHNQRTALQMTGDEFELYTAKQTALMYGATEAMLENVEKQVKALQKSRKEFELFANFEETMNAPDWIANMGGDLDSVESKIDSFGGAWSRTGSVIVDAFGDMGDAMNNYMQSMDELNSIQKELDAEKKKSGADLVKIAKLEQSVNEKKVSAELSGYKALANGAAGMFSEKTAAAKAFTAISQVLAVTEIALSYQKMAAGTAETAVHVTNETTKQGSNALTAITAAFAAPFPIGFVAGAAMIGIMASLLGGAFGGGGGSSYVAPEIGGTGTVLGDDEAQSTSITNAFDKLEDIQLDQLSELRGIRSSMQALNNGIANLAKSLVSGLDFGDTGYAGQLGTTDTFNMPSLINKMPTFIDPLLSVLDGFVGGIIGSFSSTKKELLDSGITFVSQTFADIFNSGQLDASVFQVIETTKKKFWGASKSTKVNTELSEIDNAILEQMGSIFGFIGDSVLGAVNSLFGDNLAEEMLAGFQIDIGDVSFKDKTGDEIQKELEAIFSQQADLMTDYLIPQMQKYQQMGEGLFETLMRVTQEQAIFNDAMERTGYEYQKVVSSIEKVDFAQAIIGMVGGLEQFNELSNSFFESFYSDAEQFAFLEGSLGDVFDSLGLSLVGSREEFKELINGIDITTEAGQALYAALLELVPGMDKYLSALEDEEAAKAEAAKRLADQTQNVTLRLLEEQGKSEEALAMRRRMELDAADESLRAMLKVIYALEDSARAEADRARLLSETERSLAAGNNLILRRLQLEGDDRSALEMRRRLEKKATEERWHFLLDEIYILEDAARAEAERSKAIEEAEAMADRRSNLQLRLLNAKGESEAALALTRKMELESTDESLRVLLKLIHAQEDANKAESERADQIAKAEAIANTGAGLYIQLLEAQGKSEEALALTRQQQLDTTDESLHAMLKMIYALEDSAKAEAERAEEIQAAEQLLNQSKSLQIRLLTAQGESESALALTREMELASTDESLRGLLKLIHAQEDANKLQADAYERAGLHIQLLEAQGRSEEALTLTRQRQLDALDPSLHGLQRQIWAEQELSEVRKKAEEDLNQRVSDMESQMSALDSVADGFRSISESLNAIIYGAYDAIEIGATKLDDALKMSRTGDFSGASGLSVESAIGNTSNYDSIASYNFARDVALNKIAEIRDLSASAEDVTERAIQAIDANIASVAVDIFEQKTSLSAIKDTNTSTDSNVLELVKTMKQDSESQQESNKELIILLEKMNKESVAANKILKRIEYNAQHITTTE